MEAVETMVVDATSVGTSIEERDRQSRSGIEEWVRQVESTAGRRRHAIAESTAECARIDEELSQAETVTAHVLRGIRRFAPDDVVGALQKFADVRVSHAVAQEKRAFCQRQMTDVEESLRMANTVLRAVAAHDIAAQSGNHEHDTKRMLTRLPGEFHGSLVDTLAAGPLQAMSDLYMQAEVAERRAAVKPDSVGGEVNALRTLAADATHSVQQICATFVPVNQLQLGLPEAIRTAASLPVLGDGSPRVACTIVGEPKEVPYWDGVALVRIVQEAVGNALRHAHCSVVDVVLSFATDRTMLLVADDGEGFNVAAMESLLARGNQWGLITMRYWAQQQGSALDVRSEVGKGTEVRVSLSH